MVENPDDKRLSEGSSEEKKVKETIEIRKLSAAAGGGLLGFSIAGPIGALVGTVVTSVVASVFLDDDDEQDKSDIEGGGRMNSFFISNIDPAWQILIFLFIAVSFSTAFGVKLAYFVFKAFSLILAGWLLYVDIDTLLLAWHAYDAGRESFVVFVSSLYEQKAVLIALLAGYVIVIVWAVQEFVEKLNIPHVLKKIASPVAVPFVAFLKAKGIL